MAHLKSCTYYTILFYPDDRIYTVKNVPREIILKDSDLKCIAECVLHRSATGTLHLVLVQCSSRHKHPGST